MVTMGEKQVGIERSPAYLAGYREGRNRSDAVIVAIEPPAEYTDDERGDFVVGFCRGARDADADRLMDDMEQWT
jgi:hypothetical protein